MRVLVGCLLWLVSTIGVAATAGLGPRQLQQISQLARDTLQTKHLPGIAVAVARGDSLWSAGFGQADLEQDVAVTAQSRFRIASIGKWHPRLIDGTPAPNPFGTPGYFYGFGIMVDPGSAQPAWFHTAGQSGASALLFYFPKANVAVAVMCNMDGSAVRETLARKIGAIAARQ